MIDVYLKINANENNNGEGQAGQTNMMATHRNKAKLVKAN